MTESAHSSSGCYSCHAPGLEVVGFKAGEVMRMYPRAVFGGTPTGPATTISRKACEACHVDMLDDVTEGAGGVRILHSTCAPDATCDACHSAAAHGASVRWAQEPVMETCTACHESSDVSVECDSCHTGRRLADRLTAGPWQVTHGPNWRSTHGMGQLDSCGVCHPDDYCTRCHGLAVPHPASFGSEHGRMSIESPESCEQCHRSSAYCDACHGIEMPHAAGFLKAHSAEAGTLDNPACIRCHASEDCGRCHTRHVHPGGPNMFPDMERPVGDER